MKSKWNIVYYETAKNECPVEDFINSRSLKNRAKIITWLEQLEALGPNLPRPYADLLEDGIHESQKKIVRGTDQDYLFFLLPGFHYPDPRIQEGHGQGPENRN